MFFLLQNQKTRGQNRFCQWRSVGPGGRVNLMQTMCAHGCKCKNDACSRSGAWRLAETSGGGNSSMIYLIYYKNLCKCYKVLPPSTIRKFLKILKIR
jgi:hypothetical protein